MKREGKKKITVANFIFQKRPQPCFQSHNLRILTFLFHQNVESNFHPLNVGQPL